MVADYFLIRKTELDVNSLYHREGIYYYTKALIRGDCCAGVGRCDCAGWPDLRAAALSLRLRVVRGLLYCGIVYVVLMKVSVPAESYAERAEETA